MLKLLLLLMLTMFQLDGHVIHNDVIKEEWVHDQVPPFDELIFSWNGSRPSSGYYKIYVSVKLDDWTEWLPYATWGSKGQASYSNISDNKQVKVFQDTLDVLDKQKANGFRIKILTYGDAKINDIHHLHVFINSQHDENNDNTSLLNPIEIPISGISQMTLKHPRNKDLCSPTSTTAVVRYLNQNDSINPISFAQNVWDRGFDIFGNWVFNVAQASQELGSSWSIWVERLSGFHDIYSYLERHIPIIVSVRGPLVGSALPYASGHLMVVTGFDPITQEVCCMDPGFQTESETHVRYALADFIAAWNRRGRIAYVFERNF